MNFNMNITPLKEVGGQGGSAFDACAKGSVKGLHIRSGAWIDAVQVLYTNEHGQEDSTNRFGGQGGGLGALMLEAGERIIRIGFSTGQFVNSISIETDKHRRIIFGHENSTIEYFDIPENSEFAGFYGKCGAYVDSIGVLLISSGSSSSASASEASQALGGLPKGL